MAYEWGPRGGQSYPAGVDLTEKQFSIVKLDTDGTVKLAGAGGDPTGILDNAPNVGETAAVTTSGVNKLRLAGTVAIGDQIAADADGFGVKAAEGEFVVGTAREAGTSGSIIACSVEPVHVAIAAAV